jgi:hypothetical protein
MRKEGVEKGGRGREGRKGIGFVSTQQELRVSRITLFRANSGRCAHIQTYTSVYCKGKVIPVTDLDRL